MLPPKQMPMKGAMQAAPADPAAAELQGALSSALSGTEAMPKENPEPKPKKKGKRKKITRMAKLKVKR